MLNIRQGKLVSVAYCLNRCWQPHCCIQPLDFNMRRGVGMTKKERVKKKYTPTKKEVLECMRHDAYRRVNRRVRQVRWKHG